ncbi:hypothetical protein ACP275_03G042100 [Erythranthe tilingii]
MPSLVWLLLLAHATLALSTDESISDAYKSIFILAGQSNMAGRAGVISGKLGGVVPPACTPSPFILRLNPNLTWEVARDPLHEGIDVNKPCGIGPGMPFANSVLERDSSIGVIGLVPCAIGATNLTSWSRGHVNYNRMLMRAQAALSGGRGIIRAILWFQGEGDAVLEQDAMCYKEKLKTFFNDIRSDLQLPELPIIQVALPTRNAGNYTDEIRTAQLGLKLSNMKCVDAWGLPVIQGDPVHLNTDSQIQVGHMLADAFLQLTTASPPPPPPAGESCA